VLICQGSNAGGWTFYVQDSRLHYAHNYVGRAIYRVSGADPLPAGRHQLRFEFEPTGKPDFAEGKGTPGLAQLYVDGKLIANSELPVTTPIAFNPGGLTCGADPGAAIIPDYQARAPFAFTGTLHTVTVDLSGDLITDTESEMRIAMARQ
jgi:arylsulfatase